MKQTTILLAIALLIGLIPVSTLAASDEYKDFERTTSKRVFFEITFDDDHLEVSNDGDGQLDLFKYHRSSLKVRGNEVFADDQLLFDVRALWLAGKAYPYDEITDIRVHDTDEHITITFYTRSADDRRTSRIRRGNLIAPFGTTVVEEDDFVRGFVFAVTGDIEVYGEVNKDIISLFGSVFVGPDAVIRGDILSIEGNADVARDASVYGEIFSGKGKISGRRHRFFRRQMEVSMEADMYYNRVDGIALMAGARYDDRDSVLPSVWATAGYAFESERWRYELGFEQPVLRSMPISVGGKMYRRLASEDDWLISTSENNAFTFFWTEDFKDYYEAEGARAWIRTRPMTTLELSAGYYYEETKWFEAERDLWSLFGGDKKFPTNFSSVDPVFREQGIADIDSLTDAGLFLGAAYDTRDEEDPFEYSAWSANLRFDWSAPGLDSDYDYRRYLVSVSRFQSLNRRLMLIVKGTYGGSDGYLPMHKQFYLGGLGTVRGYKHKEYMGTRFWMLNTEYRIDFPKTDLAASLHWDVGRIAKDTRFVDNDEVKHSLGVSGYIGDDFRVTLAKRLDRSENDDPKFYVRFTYSL